MNIFTKMRQSLLFAAALLCAGGTFAQEAEYGVVWSQDFENAGTYTEGWTITGTPTNNTYNGSKYLHLYSRGGSISFAGNSSFTEANNYKFEFDWNAGVGNTANRNQVLTVNSDIDGGVLFSIKSSITSTGYDTYGEIYDAAGSVLGTLNVDGYRKQSSFTFMYHVLVEASESEGVKLTISNGDNKILDGVVVSENLVHITGLTSGLANKADCMGFDNIVLSVLGASEGISTPSCSITGTYGATRTVTVTTGVGTEGTQASGTYYTIDGTEPTAESTLYEAPFTISESCTIKIISYLPDGTASEICEFAAEAGFAWPLNVDVVKVADLVGEEDVKNPVIANSYVNTGVLGNPEVSFSYTFNGEEVTLPYTVTEDGTLVATASADGYASATETLKVKASYIAVKSADFTTITEDNLVEVLGDTWSITATNTRWSGWDKTNGDIYTIATCNNPANLTDFIGSAYGTMIVGYGLARNNNSAAEYWITNPEEDQIAVYEVNEAKKATTDFVKYTVAYADNAKLSHSIYNVNAIAKVSLYSPARELVVTDGVDLIATGTYTSASYVRQFNTEYTYGTICLPFAPDAATCANYTFYKLTEVNSTALIFEEEAAPKANTAYLYKLKDGVVAESAKTFTGGVTTISGVEVNGVGGWNFIGAFAKTEITDLTGGDYWAYQATYNDKKDVLVKAGTKLIVHPYRAYFKFVPTEELNFTPATSTMRMIIGGKEGGAMEIQEVIAPEQVEGAAFDLEGRPVENMQKGQIYIIGGKKVKK